MDNVQPVLYGTYSNNVAAFCLKHHAGITVKQMRRKNRLGKQCHAFVRCEDHAFWVQRQKMRQLRDQHRRERKQALYGDFAVPNVVEEGMAVS